MFKLSIGLCCAVIKCKILMIDYRFGLQILHLIPDYSPLCNLKFWCRQVPNYNLSDTEVLKLAAGVESNTIHPVGKAIVKAARAANCPTVKVPSSLA